MLQDGPARRVAVCASHRDAVEEVIAASGQDLRFLTPQELVEDPLCWDVVIIDEAAKIPVPRLQQICAAHPGAHLAFATTTAGYEGTGKGFVLRFVAWLSARSTPVQALTLHTPIRWDPDDPLERAVFDALLLDAVPAALPGDAGAPLAMHPAEHVCLNRDALVAIPTLLRAVFGLLVHAHYRTTPSDLHRLLDAPNMAVHALLWRGHCVAVNLIAHEGAFSPADCEALSTGRRRIRGHALADTLITHGGQTAAGMLSMVRSVRIATHPDLRGRGLGAQLAAAVHRHHTPDLFGTLFGATPEVLRFRSAQGYQLVRVGGSRGDRTGEPAAIMVRAENARSQVIVDNLRAELARNLPLQLQLLDAGGTIATSPTLRAQLISMTPQPTPLSTNNVERLVRSYLGGPRSSDSVIAALRALASGPAIDELEPTDAIVIRSRIIELQSWSDTAAAAGLPTVRAAQRTLRRAVQHLWDVSVRVGQQP